MKIVINQICDRSKLDVTLESADLHKAPPEIRSWVQRTVADALANDCPCGPEERSQPPAETTAAPAETTAAPAETTAAPATTMDDCKQAAMQLLQHQGEESLAKALKSVGIRRVSECPDEKLGDLLTAIVLEK